MLSIIFDAFLLGIIGGAIPGPILTGTFTEILKSGFVKGVRVIFYALITETIGALLLFLLFWAVGVNELVIKIISVVGSVVLFWLGYRVWKINEIKTESQAVITFSRIILLTVFNSGYWIFWMTVGMPKALILNEIFSGGLLAFLLLFEFGWLVATSFLAIIFWQFRPLLQKKNLVKLTFQILSIMLFLLGIKTLISVL